MPHRTYAALSGGSSARRLGRTARLSPQHRMEGPRWRRGLGRLVVDGHIERAERQSALPVAPERAGSATTSGQVAAGQERHHSRVTARVTNHGPAPSGRERNPQSRATCRRTLTGDEGSAESRPTATCRRTDLCRIRVPSCRRGREETHAYYGAASQAFGVSPGHERPGPRDPSVPGLLRDDVRAAVRSCQDRPTDGAQPAPVAVTMHSRHSERRLLRRGGSWP